LQLGPKKLLDLEIVLHPRRTAIDGTSDRIKPSEPAVNPTFTAETQVAMSFRGGARGRGGGGFGGRGGGQAFHLCFERVKQWGNYRKKD
jgi:uncharacterized membrane protein